MNTNKTNYQTNLMLDKTIRTTVYLSLFSSFVSVCLACVAVTQNSQHTSDILVNRRNGELTRTLLRQDIAEGNARAVGQQETTDRVKKMESQLNETYQLVRRLELLLSNLEGKLDARPN